ncbi:carbon monoxide dehydrogenase [Streptomyces finlayi]|uniref:Carbon monoxide dehydrogenase n=1 Tax=Streptomyces finlayi TaxID=67296 RepID=A0A7G7BM53_9ACTN|nr:SRPBCC domain-containing protein [Streptomyces finlayi]QNE76418.1 carbon monoxide dehydrogenase [Streptomyces finlayi]
MEHEVFVPVPVLSLRRTLGDAARVARCVPGLQQDAEASAGPLAGRLKVRVGGHTITYRGALQLAGRDGDTFSVAGEGVEARGTGSAKLALTLTLTETDGGTTIGFAGTAGGDGRIADLEDAAALAAAHRLLDRFTQQLVTESLAAAPGERDAEAEAAEAAAGVAAKAAGEAAADELGAADERGAADELGAADEQAAPDEQDVSDEASCDEPEPGKGSVYDAPVPPPSLDPRAEVEFTVPDEPPAEAAHARRTMIGRSTEEVDHAPPRGRYAPVPSPDAGGAAAALRWIAPAAALALASAVVVSRALRRRR